MTWSPQVVPMIVDTLDESLWFRVGARSRVEGISSCAA
jgi:hypothetical protein